MRFAALLIVLMSSQLLAEVMPQPPMPSPIPAPIQPGPHPGPFPPPGPMYPRNLYVLAGDDYEFSLPELTGCSSDFQLGHEERKSWVKVTKDATILVSPGKSQSGKTFLVALTCEREAIVTQTKTQSGQSGIVTLVTESIPVPEKRTVQLTVHVSQSGPVQE